MGKSSFQTITHKQTLNLDSRLQVYGLSTPKAMVAKLDLLIYTLHQVSMTKEVKTITQYIKKTNHNQICGQEFIVVEFLHVAKIIHQITIKDLPTGRLNSDQHYYLNMP
jgi:hypothetical protein